MKATSRNLLTIDWDFFFPTPEVDPTGLWDWGHAEMGDLFLNGLWTHRAAGFFASGASLPGLSGEEVGFADRFKFSEDCTLYYSDSHAYAFHPEVAWHFDEGWDSIWLYDAHHDGGYGEGTISNIMQTDNVSCEDWMVAYRMVQDPIRLYMRYPRWGAWKKDAEPEPQVKMDRRVDDPDEETPVFDAIHIARSGSWVPPWLDPDFDDFVVSFPNNGEAVILDEHTPRDWDVEAVREQARRWKELTMLMRRVEA